MGHIITRLKPLIMVLIFMSSCENDEPNLSLPPKTEQGLNTLGFVINGKVWVNYGQRCTFYSCDNNEVEATLDKLPDGSLELSISGAYTVKGKKKIDQAFYLSTRNVTAVGNYALENVKGKMVFVPDESSSLSYKQFRNIKSDSPQLIISKFDTLNNIVSGEFKGVLYNPDVPAEKVEIKDGRFDIEFNFRK